MSKRIRGYVRDVETGAGVNPATVTIKKHSDNSTITSDATDANGLYEVDADTVGYPGEVYETVTVGSTTKIRSGRVWGQLGGLVWASDIPDALALMGIGVGNGLAVSADGSDMNVDISAGMALLKDGCPYILEAADDLTIGAADVSNPRIDRIILRLTREGQTDQGKITLMVLAGTAAASPAAPSLTQTSATWDLSLAQVLVGTGVATIAADKVTDERTYCLSYPDIFARGVSHYVGGTTTNPAGSPDASTTSTTTYAVAFSDTWILPKGTWTITGMGDCSFINSSSGDVDFYLEIDGSGALTRTPNISATVYSQWSDHIQASGIVSDGVTGITVKIKYRSHTGGTTTPQAPKVHLTAVRTA